MRVILSYLQSPTYFSRYRLFFNNYHHKDDACFLYICRYQNDLWQF